MGFQDKKVRVFVCNGADDDKWDNSIIQGLKGAKEMHPIILFTLLNKPRNVKLGNGFECKLYFFSECPKTLLSKHKLHYIYRGNKKM